MCQLKNEIRCCFIFCRVERFSRYMGWVSFSPLTTCIPFEESNKISNSHITIAQKIALLITVEIMYL